MTKKYLLLLAVFFLIPGYAMAHGKAMELANSGDVAKACGGSELVPDESASKNSAVKWMKDLRPDGSTSAIVGFDRVKTRHGYFVQATCISKDSGDIKSVVLMRAMGEEVGGLKTAMQNKNWFSVAPAGSRSAVVSGLYRSVRKIQKAFEDLSAGIVDLSPGKKS